MMKKRNRHLLLLRDVLDGSRAQPGRIGLSFFAVTIGIIALTVLLAILGGLRTRARVLMSELGGNVIAISGIESGDAEEGLPLTSRDVGVLSAGFPDCPVSAIRRADVPAMGKDERVTVLETDSGLAEARGWRVSAGRFLDRQDVVMGERHAVLSLPLAREWRTDVGEVVTLGESVFVVVGLVDAGAGAVESSSIEDTLAMGDRIVMVPRSAPGSWQKENREAQLGVDRIFLRVPAARRIEEVLIQAQRALTKPGRAAAEQLSWMTPDIILANVRRLQNTMKLAGGSIALLCLVLGGTTLMSLMVANVRDRIPEIGLRRALGARGRDIAVLFVVEAVTVTGCAAVVGVAVSYLLLSILRHRFSAPLTVDGTVLLVPVLLSLVLGIVFSWWPARLAVRISPAEALRND